MGQNSRIIFPVSEIQKQFWMVNQIHPDSSAYNIASVFRITGEPDIKALTMGMNDILRRHQVLRAEFHSENNDLVQVIRSDLALEVSIDDMSSYPPEKKETESQRIVDDEVNRPFDLAKAPLVRSRVIRLAPAEYMLIIVMHHIITDMESKDIFGRELSKLYANYANHNTELLPMPETCYSDYADRQKKIVAEKGYAPMANFWKQALAGQSGYLNLPHDLPRPAAVTEHGGRCFLEIKGDDAARLREFSKKNSVNLFVTMLGLYFLLLHRLSGQNDISVGVPFTNRRSDDIKETMGCFVNILPLAVTLPERVSFAGLLKQVRMAMLAGHRNQEIPFSVLINEIRPKRDASYNPLFQSGFTFEHPMKIELAGCRVESLSIRRYSSQLDLFMTLWENEDAIAGYLEYNTDLFTPALAGQINDCFLKLAQSACDDPDLPICCLPMLKPDEERKILKEWNNTGRDYNLSVCLHRLFEGQAGRTPERTALVCNGKSLTYRELNERANRLARRLVKHGAGPDRIVGVYMERSAEMVISLYAILKAGGAYLPLEPGLPAMRINYMVEDAEPVIILTHSRLEKNIMNTKPAVLALDPDLSAVSEESAADFDSGVTNENLAYCIYTSGSTGNPKGVLIPHRGICNRLHWMQEDFLLNENDRVLQKTPFSFDVSVWEFFWPLICGAALVVAEPGGHLDSAYLVNAINQEKITVIHFVPAMLDVFLREPGAGDCSSLRYVICSGEALSYQLQERFFRAMQCGLHNLYGPTEASVDVTAWKCSKDFENKIVPIGFPIANTRMYILNACLRPAPVGVTGDLYIGGVQLARGYLNRDELTGERFIPDPFDARPGARLYKTGDLARWLPNGAIEFLGRSDNQIKFHGLRIELGEIEAAIEQYPAVAQAVVVTHSVENTMRLIAYYTRKEGSACNASAIRDFLKDRLSLSVIPSHFIEILSFPVTANGKIDRKALPAPSFHDARAEEVSDSLSDLERKILMVWKEFLKIDKAGLQDNFFDIGGHSLLMTLINNRLRRDLGIKLSMVEMFQYPTIASLAAYLGKNSKADASLGDIEERGQKQKNAFQRMKKK